MNKDEFTSSLTIKEEFGQRILDENRKARLIRWAPTIVMVGLIAGFSLILGDVFFSVANLRSLLNQLTIPMVISVGMTFVIIMGSIDLSVDGAVGMAGTFFAMMVLNSRETADLGTAPALMITMAAGAGIGFLNGFFSVKVRIPSFMVTLAFTNICVGLALVVYRAEPPVIKDEFLTNIMKVTLFDCIPVVIIVPIIVIVVALYFQNYTPFGRYIYAIGTDERIPRAAGINVDRIKILAFVFAGVCFAIAGSLGAVRMGKGDFTIGSGLLFPSQAAVVVGGTSLSGGIGGVHKTIIGVVIMTVLQNGLLLMGLDIAYKYGISGAVILIAVALTIKHGDRVISK